jgi:hypothetical protein
MTLTIGLLGPVDEGLGWLIGKALDPVKDLAFAPIKAVARGIADAVGSVLEVLGTLWIRLDVPSVWGTTASPRRFSSCIRRSRRSPGGSQSSES